jgi:hypothetical protein
MLRLLLTFVVSLLIIDAFAADISSLPVVFETGSWRVLASTDNMTDKRTCTGVYKDNYGIQLTEDKLMLSVRGGIQFITLRFDDEPPMKGRLPVKMEKDVGVIIIEYGDFNKALNSKRLRTNVLTLVRGVSDNDIDLTGISDAVANIKAGCPALPAVEKAKASPSQPAPQTADTLKPEAKPEATKTAPLCSEELVARMKAKGLKQDQIKDICKE